MEYETDQLDVLKADINESCHNDSPDDTIKAYNALHMKFQCLVREYYGKSNELRDVSRYLMDQIEYLNKENKWLYQENK